MTTHAVVLAAGKGTRMKSDLAKVLHLAAGRPLVAWMLDVLAPLPIDHTVVVVGHQADRVRAVLPEAVDTALQEEQNGTGHAVMVALDSFEPDPDDTVLVIPGDMPLIESGSLQRLFDVHRAEGAAASKSSRRAMRPRSNSRSQSSTLRSTSSTPAAFAQRSPS